MKSERNLPNFLIYAGVGAEVLTVLLSELSSSSELQALLSLGGVGAILLGAGGLIATRLINKEPIFFSKPERKLKS